ncbi:undecaprenyl-diphosphate phosphatase [Gordonia sp. (in: high G+C Gram-positive bacteria)]|uniref:undecaprenyl-diphosphate phosphatase n=1 Tax=Gordonia sp. (in: high G+C Gram-positive bacteria) TaxID=84139 RepID=UPI0039E300A3
MTWLQTIVLSVVQGLTEFLPISSSGHLLIVSRLLWDSDAGASFTAVSQLGTELAVLVFFWRDIWRIIVAWFAGLRNPSARGADYKIGWAVIVATIPIGIIGYFGKNLIRDDVRANLYITATVLILFSGVFWIAERYATQQRTLEEVTMRDAVVVGLAQCLALIPGVSRSGSSASAGLLIGFDREAAFRLSFLLAIPAVFASGLFSLPDAFHPDGVGLAASGPQLLVSVVIAFVVGYAAIAWLLKFVADHSLNWFGVYRVALGLLLLVLLGTGVITSGVPAH